MIDRSMSIINITEPRSYKTSSDMMILTFLLVAAIFLYDISKVKTANVSTEICEAIDENMIESSGRSTDRNLRGFISLREAMSFIGKFD